jgi:hypothetical protein
MKKLDLKVWEPFVSKTNSKCGKMPGHDIAWTARSGASNREHCGR